MVPDSVKHPASHCPDTADCPTDEKNIPSTQPQESVFRVSLAENSEENYRRFVSMLMPAVPKETILGVRTPVLKKIARQWAGTEAAERFLSRLPHELFEENQLHAFLISLDTDFDRTLTATEQFLPFVDNWATCDQLLPHAFRGQLPRLLPSIRRWMAEDRPYTVRFGIGMLMRLGLDDGFDPVFLQEVAEIDSREYYVRMMQAWFFATAAAKQYEAVLPYFRDGRLSPWVQNTSIRKACESARVPEEHKAVLRRFRMPPAKS